MKTRTLEQRIWAGRGKHNVYSYIRAELDRLARAARKGIASGKIVSPAQVIDLIKEAKR